MNLCIANDDIFLARLVGHNVHGVSHLGKGIGHLSDTCRRAVVGGKWTSGYHGDGIVFRFLPQLGG